MGCDRNRFAELEDRLEAADRERLEWASFVKRGNQQFEEVVARYLGDTVDKEQLKDKHWTAMRAAHKEFSGMIKKMEVNLTAERDKAQSAEEALEYFQDKHGYKQLRAEHEETLQTVGQLSAEVSEPRRRALREVVIALLYEVV